ncbi:hypothetical protein ACHAXR_005951 [Thalassiosira sp. AJA248-18]
MTMLHFILLALLELWVANAQHAPLALHHLHEVANGDEVVISLRGHDLDGDKTHATITKLPRVGELFQLSHVFDKHGYDPKAGSPITSVPTIISGKDSRVVYRRPKFDYRIHQIGSESWKERDAVQFEYTVNDGNEEESQAGTVTFVSDTTRQLVSSDFRFMDEGWKTVGNTKSNVRHEATRRGEMNNYIYAVDDLIDVDAEKNDRQLWKFLLPEKYTGWYGAWYGGTFEFTLSSFSGDYSGVNDHWVGDKHHPLNLVEIYCESCDLFKGATIAFPLSAQTFDGQTTQYSMTMTESAGWVKDPQNTLYEWTAPTRCSFIEVLSGISNVTILGDFTNWYESVSIDNVRWVAAPSKGRYQIPLCAQDTPNCRKCSC